MGGTHRFRFHSSSNFEHFSSIFIVCRKLMCLTNTKIKFNIVQNAIIEDVKEHRIFIKKHKNKRKMLLSNYTAAF